MLPEVVWVASILSLHPSMPVMLTLSLSCGVNDFHNGYGTNCLARWKYPNGGITNSDLQLVGIIAQNDELAQNANVAERTTHNCYDNIPAVYWQRKGATTTIGPAAYLLWLQGLHQQLYQYVPLRDYIPGFLNEMADILSRHWDLSGNRLIAYFNTYFPQKRHWRLCLL